MSVDLIVVCDENRGIGLRNGLPWFCKEELAVFREKTMQSVLLVGRKTAESLPYLPGRFIVCLQSKLWNGISCECEDAISYAQKRFPGKKIFVAGGGKTYKKFLEKPNLIDKVHISIMKGKYECDTYLDINLSDFVVVEKKDYAEFTHYVLKNSPDGEKQYLTLLRNVLTNGVVRDGRNGETKSLFFGNLSFDLRQGFPLLTTKKMFFRGIIEELLFFLRGDTNSKLLEEKGVNIWKGNTCREFLDSLGMKNRPEGMMGPMYGYQLRHFNARYDETTGKPLENGIDQLKNVIDLIKTDPGSRRIVMTDFNPCQAMDGVLYPCHSIVVQFYVIENSLDMFCYNRSQDLFLGTPFNIASSALLLCIIANVTKLQPRFLHMSLGDTHIYKCHYDVVKEQIERFRYLFPTLRIIKDLQSITDIEEMQSTDIVLENYVSNSVIKAEMVA